MFVTKAGGLVVQVSNVDYVDAVSRIVKSRAKDKRYHYNCCCPIACSLVRAGFRRSAIKVYPAHVQIEGFGSYNLSRNGRIITSRFDVQRGKYTGTVSLVKCK